MVKPIGYIEDYVSLVVQQLAQARASSYLLQPKRSEHEVRNARTKNRRGALRLVVSNEHVLRTGHRSMLVDRLKTKSEEDTETDWQDWSSDHGQGQF